MKKIIALVLCLVTLVSAAAIGASAAEAYTAPIGFETLAGRSNTMSGITVDRSGEDVPVAISIFAALGATVEFVEKPDYISLVGNGTWNDPYFLVIDNGYPQQETPYEITIPMRVNKVILQYPFTEQETVELKLVFKVTCTHQRNVQKVTLRKATLFLPGAEEYICRDCGEIISVKTTPALLLPDPVVTVSFISSVAQLVTTVISTVSSWFRPILG